MTAQAARLLGLHVGAVVPMGFTPTPSHCRGGSGRHACGQRSGSRRGSSAWSSSTAGWSKTISTVPRRIYCSLRRLPGLLAAHTSGGISWYGLRLRHGARDVAAVEREISGRLGNTGRDQIVLGPGTLAQLHQHVGGTVMLARIAGPANIHARLTIVGTATMPTVGFSQVLHTSMGTGALVSAQLLPTRAGDCIGPPGMAFVRLRPRVSPAAGLASIRRTAAGANRALAAALASSPCHGDILGVLPVQHPAQIANYRTMGATPALLAFGLAAGAVAALGLTLFASVRRRRRDLAVLKTIGFTQRQLAATVTWQATIAAIIGIAAGGPLGIILGRWLWTLFARQIYAVPEPTVPAASVALLALGTLLLVNLVAALPGRAAARTPAALALRAE